MIKLIMKGANGKVFLNGLQLTFICTFCLIKKDQKIKAQLKFA